MLPARHDDSDQLFDPREGERYSKDEDHLALCIELLGRMPKKLTQRVRPVMHDS